MLMSSSKKKSPERIVKSLMEHWPTKKDDWESRRNVENVERDTCRFKGLFSLLFRIVCGLPHGFRGGFPVWKQASVWLVNLRLPNDAFICRRIRAVSARDRTMKTGTRGMQVGCSEEGETGWDRGGRSEKIGDPTVSLSLSRGPRRTALHRNQ